MVAFAAPGDAARYLAYRRGSVERAVGARRLSWVSIDAGSPGRTRTRDGPLPTHAPPRPAPDRYAARFGPDTDRQRSDRWRCVPTDTSSPVGVRSGGHRRWSRRLRRSAVRHVGRPERRRRREGRDGRHLPQPWVHPGQGVPRDRRRAAPRRPRRRLRHRVERPGGQLRTSPRPASRRSSTASSRASPGFMKSKKITILDGTGTLGPEPHGHGRTQRRRHHRPSPAPTCCSPPARAAHHPRLRPSAVRS